MKQLWITLYATGMTAVAKLFGDAVPAQEAPNILLIVTDDQRWDSISAYGASDLAHTPHIDKLAEEGVLFTKAYENCGVCAPSRHSFLTGCYPHQTGVYNFDYKHSDVPFWRPFITEMLHQRDYQTAVFGKIDTLLVEPTRNGKEGRRIWPTYDAMISLGVVRAVGCGAYNTGSGKWTPEPPAGQTVDEAYGLLRAYSRNAPHMQALIIGGYNPRPEGQQEEDAMVEFMRDWLTHHAAKDRPVFVNIGASYPHTPILPPKDLAKEYEAKVAGRKLPHGSPEEYSEFCDQMKTVYHATTTDGLNDKDHEKFVAHYYADCEYGDRAVGKAIEQFKTWCGDKPWLIVFYSDHGYHIGEHGFGAKWTFREQSLHVPMVVASSDKIRFPAGTVCDDPVELVDVVPTLLAAAGEDLSRKQWNYLAGRDLSRTARGEIAPRAFTYSEIGHWWGHRAGIRSDKWQFSMRVRPQDYTPMQDFNWVRRALPRELEMELFDLKNDPEERHNLAYSEAYSPQVELFKAIVIEQALGSDRIEYDWKAETQGKSWWGRPVIFYDEDPYLWDDYQPIPGHWMQPEWR